MPGVAVIGASTKRIPWTAWLLDSLDQYGYADPIWLVNPGYEQLLGRPCLPSLDAVDGNPELGVVLTNPDQAVVQCEALAERGCSQIIVVSNGFGELRTDDGRARDAALRRIAAAHGVEIIGPNCVGFASFHDGICAITQPVPLGVRPGPVSIFSQSGGLTGAALGAVHREGLGVDLCYSIGNGAVFGLPEAIVAAAARPTTEVVCCVVEALADPAALEHALSHTAARDVVVVALLLGRSEGGRGVAQSHTGAIVGESQLIAAWLEERGVVVVGSAAELARVATLHLRLGSACRTGAAFVATVSGGAAGLTADLAARHGLPLAWLAPETRALLRELLPSGAYIGNPLDVQTGDGSAVYTALASDPGVGYLIEPWVLPWPDDSGRFPHQRAALERITGIGRECGTPVLVSSLWEQEPTPWALSLEADGGVCVTSDLELTMAALSRLARPEVRDALVPEAMASPHSPRSENLVTEAEARRILLAAGLPVVEGREAASPAEAVAHAEALRPPFAVKVSLPGVGHKERVGGVRLGLASPEAVRAACAEIAAGAVAAGVAGQETEVGFLVTEMAFGAEILVGALRDPVAGPTVTVAVGGWAAEAGLTLGTIVGAREAAELETLARRWGLPRLLGERRSADLAGFLAGLTTAFVDGPLSAYGTVELNPLLLTVDGPVIVDALMVRGLGT